MPALAIGAQLLGSVVSSNAQEEAGQAAQRQDQIKAQAAQADAQQQAAATIASAQPALATVQSATYNAAIAGQQAQLALDTGQEKEQEYRINSATQISEQKGALAASGIAVSGSALDVLANSSKNAELNALSVRHSSLVEAQAYLNGQTLDQAQAKNAKSQADFIYQNAAYIAARGPMAAAAYEEAGKSAASAGDSAAAATLLGGVSGGLSRGLSMGLFGQSGGGSGSTSLGPGEGASLSSALASSAFSAVGSA